MNPVYRILPDSSFVCGDSASRVTCYAYAASPRAHAARTNPRAFATRTLARELRTHRGSARLVEAYDRANWKLLQPDAE